MNDETLSALIDGECTRAELDQLLRRMERDPALRERYNRQVLALEIRRGAKPSAVRADFAERVLAALPPAPSATVLPLRTRMAWQPLAGLAAAAGLGAVAVMALKPEPAAPPSPAPLASAPPSVADPAVADLDSEQARQLRNYVMSYSHSRAQHGVGGTLGYARYAAYTTDPADDSKDGER
jgi:negative regulator of sigma E activity